MVSTELYPELYISFKPNADFNGFRELINRGKLTRTRLHTFTPTLVCSPLFYAASVVYSLIAVPQGCKRKLARKMVSFSFIEIFC